MNQAMQTPLVDLLRGTPKDGRVCHEESLTSHHFIPYGRLCHEAADTIEALRRQVGSLTKAHELNHSRYLELCRQLAAMTQERDDLLAEKSRWIARANNYLGQACENVSANSMLIAAQADNARLREALERYVKAIDDLYKHNDATRSAVVQYFGVLHPQEAIATQPDHAALDARLKEERERCAKVCEEESDSGFMFSSAIRSLT
jgi:hypothetical protein